MTTVPKLIHYCWFGRNPKPQSVLEFIENWKNKLPDYQIIEWNEDNFDVNSCLYTKQAYENKKFAFVSDYARLYALYHQGGLYLDTDVEICQDPSEIINKATVTLGIEECDFVATSTIVAMPKSDFIKTFMQSYHERKFVRENGELDMTTNVEVLTEMLKEVGFLQMNQEQWLDFNSENIHILTQEFLSPYDYINLIDKSTANTLTIHHFGNSSGSKQSRMHHALKKSLKYVFGAKGIKFVRKFIK